MGKDLSLIFSDFASQDWPRQGGIGWGTNGCLWAFANMAHSGMGGLGKNLVSNQQFSFIKYICMLLKTNKIKFSKIM